MTVVEVAARLGVGRSRVHGLDHELNPERCACGQRRYTEAAVAAYEARRAVAREALSKQRAARMHAIRDKFQPRRRFAPGNAWRR
jgi:hypothetical protein